MSIVTAHQVEWCILRAPDRSVGREGRYRHFRNVFRPLLGNRLWDHSADPSGYAHAHCAGPDRLNATTPTNVSPVHEVFAEQYRNAPTELFAATRP